MVLEGRKGNKALGQAGAYSWHGRESRAEVETLTNNCKLQQSNFIQHWQSVLERNQWNNFSTVPVNNIVISVVIKLIKNTLFGYYW